MVHRKSISVCGLLSFLKLFVPLTAFAHAPIHSHNTTNTVWARHQTCNFCRDLEVHSTFSSTQTQRHPDMDTLYPGDLIVLSAEPSIRTGFSVAVLSCSLCELTDTRTQVLTRTHPLTGSTGVRLRMHKSPPLRQKSQRIENLRWEGGRRDWGSRLLATHPPILKQPALGCNSLEGRTKIAVSTSV